MSSKSDTSDYRISVRLPADLHRAIKAATKGPVAPTRSQVVVEALRRYLKVSS